MANDDFSVLVLDKVDEFGDLIGEVRASLNDEAAFLVAKAQIEYLINQLNNLGVRNES
jgi:hypothetical protein